MLNLYRYRNQIYEQKKKIYEVAAKNFFVRVNFCSFFSRKYHKFDFDINQSIKQKILTMATEKYLAMKERNARIAMDEVIKDVSGLFTLVDEATNDDYQYDGLEQTGLYNRIPEHLFAYFLIVLAEYDMRDVKHPFIRDNWKSEADLTMTPPYLDSWRSCEGETCGNEE